MYLTSDNLMSAFSLAEMLGRFPGLEGHQQEMEQLTELRKSCEELMTTAQAQPVDTASGIRVNQLTPEYEEKAKEPIENSLKIVKKLKADKELMEREPFLKAYLGIYEMNTERSLSDREDTYEYMADDAVAVATSVTEIFENIPTGQDYEKLPEKTRQTADKFLNFMEAYADCYGLREMVNKAVRQNPEGISDAKCKEAEDKGLEKLQQATKEFAKITKEDATEFYRSTGSDNGSLKRSINTLYDDKKHNPKTAEAQLSERRKVMRENHLMPEEARLLQNYATLTRGVMNDVPGLTVDDVPKPYNEWAKEIVDLGKDCRQKAKEGFQSEEEKLGFFKNLGEKTRSFTEKVDQLASSDAVDPKKLTPQENRAMTNILMELRVQATNSHGGMAQSMKKETRIKNAERAQTPEFAGQMKQFYDMMKDTGEGYLFHKNSSEYKKMMDTAKVVAELAGKNPLNDVQREALGDSFGKLSADCQAYLAKAGVGKKSREVGEDRFTGALGILNLVDKESAERVRAEAQTKRKTEVTFDGLQQRAQVKATERLLREPQVINQPEPKQPEAKNAAPKVVEPEKRLNGVEQARKRVNDWYDKLKAVDYNMLGTGSNEFREVMESMEDLKSFADRRLVANNKGNIDLDNMLDFHDKESAAIGKLQAYLDHKEEQLKTDPGRRDDPKRQKREQPRIRAAVDLLEEMKTSRAEREAMVVSAMQEQARPKVEKMLANEETRRQAANISHEDYVKSANRSLDMIKNLDGRNWTMGANENLRHFCDRVRSYTDETRYEKSLNDILEDRNDPARPILKEAHKLFKGDKKDPEAFPGGQKLSNVQLAEKYAKLRSDQGAPYLEAKDIKPYDLKEKKTQIRNENKRMKEKMVSQPKKQAEMIR